MPQTPITLSRLAETTYARFAAPQHITVTAFGRVARDPRCPDDWYFFDSHCQADEVDALFKTIDAAWPAGRECTWIGGTDHVTQAHLRPRLLEQGWREYESTLMVFERPPQLEANPAVRIQTVDAATDPVYYDIGLRNATPHVHEHRRLQDARLGGEGLIAWIGNEPVGYGGWYIVDGLARYRRIGTLKAWRRQHVCTTIVRHVQNLPVVAAADALVIGGGSAADYTKCGFVQHGSIWMFSRT